MESGLQGSQEWEVKRMAASVWHFLHFIWKEKKQAGTRRSRSGPEMAAEGTWLHAWVLADTGHSR